MEFSWMKQNWSGDRVETHCGSLVEDKDNVWCLFVLKTSESTEARWKWIVRHLNPGIEPPDEWTGTDCETKEAAMENAELVVSRNYMGVRSV